MGGVVRAQAYVRHQGGGGSDPHMIRGSDGELYVVKFRGNPQENSLGGARILSNELVATKVGGLTGAPCPETAVILVDDEMIQSAGIRPTRLYFDRATVTRTVRLAMSLRPLEGLLPDTEVARHLGRTGGWLRARVKEGSIGPTWLHRDVRGMVHFYFDAEDLRRAEILSGHQAG